CARGHCVLASSWPRRPVTSRARLATRDVRFVTRTPIRWITRAKGIVTGTLLAQCQPRRRAMLTAPVPALEASDEQTATRLECSTSVGVLRVTMGVQGVAEQVQVSAETPVLEPKRQTVSTNITNQEL